MEARTTSTSVVTGEVPKRLISPNVTNMVPQYMADLELVHPTYDYTVVVYSVIFIFGLLSNAYIFVRYIRADQAYHTKAHQRLFHIVGANLLICLFDIPMEIGWRWTVAWKAGDAGCKILQFFRVLGLYALANNLMAIALDKVMDVQILLRGGIGNAASVTKWFMAGAWFVSVACSLPQIVVFKAGYTVHFPNVIQCVATEIFPSVANEHIYNVFMLSFMFIIPSVVMVMCYGYIFHSVKSTNDLPEDLENHALTSVVSQESGLDPQMRSRFFSVGAQSRTSAGTYSNYRSESTASHADFALSFHLRSTDGTYIILDSAFDKDLRVFFTISLTFIITSLPYMAFTLWYLIDIPSHSDIHPILQELPFVLVLTNTLLIPAVYGLRLCITY